VKELNVMECYEALLLASLTPESMPNNDLGH
jgi:hypothetical protein